MENWGLLTFRTVALLFDEETSDARLRNTVAYLVAHGESNILNQCSKPTITLFRIGSSVVRQSCHYGLVE